MLFRLILVLVVIPLQLMFVSSAVAAPSCFALLENEFASPRSRPLRFMSYNVFNLYLRQGRYFHTDYGMVKADTDRLPRQKSDEQTLGVAKAILELRPDFIFLQEVEGGESLELFNEHYLGSEYETYLAPTNDVRNISIAFLVRKRTRVRVEYETFEYKNWESPASVREPLLSRNFLIAKIFKEGKSIPSMILGGLHLKSESDRQKDPGSKIKRAAELKYIGEVLNARMKDHPQAPVVVMGDFNTARGGGETHPIFDKLYMTDVHRSEDHFFDPDGLGHSTHTYHPKVDGVEMPASATAIDRAFVSKDLLDYITQAGIYRYRTESGQKKPLPQTQAERNENPSDHYPIYFDLKPELLFD
jgi:endonuclease/exonuclease/phosphatase family metal-dependent hydrolase